MNTLKTAADVTAAKTADLVAYFNANSGKDPIKKFADRATAEKRVNELLAAQPAPKSKKGAATAPRKDRRTADGKSGAERVKPATAAAIEKERIAALLAEGRCPHCSADADKQAPGGREGEAMATTHKVCNGCGTTYNVSSGRKFVAAGVVNPERAAAIAQSWANPDVAAARAQRNQVKVGGEVYASVRAAFKALGLDDNKHIKFRMELKASETGKATFEGHKFALVPAAAPAA